MLGQSECVRKSRNPEFNFLFSIPLSPSLAAIVAGGQDDRQPLAGHRRAQGADGQMDARMQFLSFLLATGKLQIGWNAVLSAFGPGVGYKKTVRYVHSSWDASFTTDTTDSGAKI